MENQNKALSGSEAPSPALRAQDLNAITFRIARSITERIQRLAHKHEVQYWLDAPGTDTEKLGRVLNEARDLMDLLDTALAPTQGGN